MALSGWDALGYNLLCVKLGTLYSLKLVSEFLLLSFVFLSFVVVVAISWAAPAAYGGSQARGLIRATAASLQHSHSHGNSGSEPCLQTTPQLTAMPDP